MATAFVVTAGADLLMITGDLTLNGLPKEFRAAEAWLARLPQPMLVTPGNHDTPYWNIPLRALVPFNRYRRYVGAPQASRLDIAGLHARMINTARGFQPRLDWSKGAVNLDLARAATQAVAGGAVDDLRIIGCHHPLVEVERIGLRCLAELEPATPQRAGGRRAPGQTLPRGGHLERRRARRRRQALKRSEGMAAGQTPRPRTRCMTKETRKSTRKTTNRT